MTSTEIPFVSSTANPRVKELSKLKNSPSSFLIEGYHLIEMAFKAGNLDEVYFEKEAPSYLDKSKLTRVSRPVIEKLSSTKCPEGIVGVCHIDEPKSPLGNRILVIDRVQDPGNVGTMLRSALAFGFLDVIFLPNTCSYLNDKAILASQGAIFALKLRNVESEEALIKMMEEGGVSLYATALEGASPLESYPFTKKEKMAFILGNEGKGVSKNLLEKAKAKLFISMEGIDSLNVGVATGILLHSIYVL